MEDDCLLGDVSLYLSTPERMVRDSTNVHLAFDVGLVCVRVCMCVCAGGIYACICTSNKAMPNSLFNGHLIDQ